jgi:hypothetical protein
MDPYTRPYTADDLIDQMERGQEEGQGVWAVECYDARTAMGHVIAAAMDPDYAEQELANLLAGIMVRIIRTADDPETATLCLTCNAPLGKGPPGVLVVLHPHTPHTKRGIGAAMCRACGELPDVMPRVLAFYEKRLFNADLRVIRPHSPGSA